MLTISPKSSVWKKKQAFLTGCVQNAQKILGGIFRRDFFKLQVLIEILHTFLMIFHHLDTLYPLPNMEGHTKFRVQTVILRVSGDRKSAIASMGLAPLKNRCYLLQRQRAAEIL